jgi:hypothetical protein
MPQFRLLVPVFLLGLLGCSTTEQASRPVPVRALRPASEPSEDIVLLDVMPVEYRLGDAFAERGLWQIGDEQCLSDLEVKPVLERNGLRVCRLAGALPAAFHNLLSARYCPEPRRMRAKPGELSSIQMGKVRPNLAFQLNETGNELVFSQAKCLLEVQPTPVSAQSMSLRIHPALKHGEARIRPGVAHDEHGSLHWTVNNQEAHEAFQALAFQVQLGAADYLVIGPCPEKPNSLGSRWLLPDGERGTHGLLLVLRTTQASQFVPAPPDIPQSVGPAASVAAWSSNSHGGQ